MAAGRSRGNVRSVPVPILFADNDAELRLTLGEILDREGYACAAVATPEEALEALDLRVYGMVLTDTFVGGPDPLHWPSAIAKRAQPTPVGLLTGWPVSSEEARARGLRFRLTKPFELSELFFRIAAALGSALDPQFDERARVAHSWFDALSRHDYERLVSLCAEDVRYIVPGEWRFSAVITGRAALLDYTRKTFAHFPESRFDEVVVHATPGGVSARYRGSWNGGVLAGCVSFELRGAQIVQVGVELNHRQLEKLTGAPQVMMSP